MKKNWWIANVVWYDGCDAFVSKFVVRAEGDVLTEIDSESTDKIRKYLDGNGELLKIDMLYTVDLDNILALKEYTDQPELQAAYNRFKEMWF